MSGYFVGEMPVDSFVQEFLPCPDGSPEAPKSATHFGDLSISNNDEKTLYKPFIDCVNTSLAEGKHIFPHHKIVDSSNYCDPNSTAGHKIKCDLHAYVEEFDATKQVNDTDAVRVNIEVKRKGFDPFTEFDCSRAQSTADPEPSQLSLAEKYALEHPLEPSAYSRVAVRGQLISYATEIMSRQHRTHLFTLLILDQNARFIRWDRAGAIVSAAFDYTKNSQPLVDFFWRLGTYWDSLGGLDPTVRLADPAEQTLAKELLQQWAPTDVSRPVVVLTVPSFNGLPDQRYVAWGALATADSPIGRATRGWAACNVETKELGFLKDAWRSPELLQETETLLTLQRKRCRNVPTLVCGGDLGQVTRTQDYSGCAWNSNGSAEKVIVRQHVRFVVKEVGLPLSAFENSSDLLRLVFDAFLGHKDAFTKCRLLHRDISAGNILIATAGDGRRHGILNDWDLAKSADGLDGARTPDRTGTWQFMSHRLLMDPTIVHRLSDDLESFLYVALHQGLVFCESESIRFDDKPADVPGLINAIFDEGIRQDGAWVGGNGKYVVLTTWALKPKCKFKNPALNVWLKMITQVLRKAMMAEHDLLDASVEPSQDTVDNMKGLEQHSSLQSIWQAVLDELPPSPLDDKVPIPGGYLRTVKAVATNSVRMADAGASARLSRSSGSFNQSNSRVNPLIAGNFTRTSSSLSAPPLQAGDESLMDYDFPVVTAPDRDTRPKRSRSPSADEASDSSLRRRREITIRSSPTPLPRAVPLLRNLHGSRPATSPRGTQRPRRPWDAFWRWMRQ
ncbi:hypothetical protein HGRIS_011665 [Hohenbuehelia grisea]|uniref:Fungal-type protein kinase domain-containing protein n=1 Tax=Hohenbuehelia grisea TaxID=104357 RepID=A0ABR3JX69_9AGAR